MTRTSTRTPKKGAGEAGAMASSHEPPKRQRRAGGAAGRRASASADLSLPQQALDRWGRSPRPRRSLSCARATRLQGVASAGDGTGQSPGATQSGAKPVADGLPERSSGAAASPQGAQRSGAVAGLASSQARCGSAALADGRLRPPASVRPHITSYIANHMR